MSKQIVYLNASALKDAACLRRLYYLIIEGYKEKVNNVATEYGSAFHIFSQKMQETGGNFNIAVKAATQYFEDTPHISDYKKAYMTKMHLAKTCIDYYQEIEEKSDFQILEDGHGNPLVEVPFVFPIYSDDYMEFLGVGTMDRIGKFRNGCFAIRDYKTSGYGATDKEKAFSFHQLRPQMIFYRLTIRRYAAMFPGSIWETLEAANPFVFIDGVFVKKDGSEFARSRYFNFTKQDLDEFEGMLLNLVEQFKPYVRANQLPPRFGWMNGSCDKIFFKCKFWNVCAAPDEVVQQHLLNANFNKVPYNPLENRKLNTEVSEE